MTSYRTPPATTAAFLWFIVSAFRLQCVTALAMQTLASISAVCLPWALSQVIRGAIRYPAAPDLLALLLLPVLAYLALTLTETLFGRLRDAIQVRFRPRMRQFATTHLYAHLQYHSHRYFSDMFAGSLAHRVSETAQGSGLIIWMGITELWPAAVVLTVSIALLFHAHTGLGLFFLLWSLLFVSIAWWLAARAEPSSRSAAAARSETTGLIVDALANQQSVRLFAREAHEAALLQASQSKELEHVLIANRYTERVRWFQYGFAALLKAGTLALALYLLEKKEIGVTELVLAVTLSFLIINEVSALSRRFFDLFEASASVSNGLATLIRRHDIKNTGTASVARVAAGNITLQDISFAYPDAAPVFSHLNLSIAAGEKVGLVGYSGAGKSTLLNLILRQYEAQSGRILIDGIDIRDMTQDSLRSRIGYIPQDPSLFHRSLRENIGYGDLSASDAQIEAAARKAGAHEFISALPEGYDAMVGERGVKLSGGQRQRVILARVLLKNAPIVILDEATASLDAITEKMILDSLENELADKTVIVIAHRLSTVAQLDRILVLDQGQIREDAAYADLLYKNDAVGNFGSQMQPH